MTDVRMSLADAAAELGVPVNTLRSRFKAGKIRGERDNTGKLWVWISPSNQPSKVRTSKLSKLVRNYGEIEALRGTITLLQQDLEIARAELAGLRPRASAADRLEGQVAEAEQRIADMKQALDHAHDEKMALLNSLSQPPARMSFWHRLFGKGQ